MVGPLVVQEPLRQVVKEICQGLDKGKDSPTQRIAPASATERPYRFVGSL